MNSHFLRPVALLVLVLLAGIAAAVTPQGLTFTYQGQLRNSGTVVNGNHNLAFSLWDAASGGSQVGSTVTANSWPVVDGLFTIDLTFAGAFAGDQRWLEVSVDGTPLAPRQPVSATPVAQYALSGNPGPQGDIGYNTLSATAAEPAGANCTNGGSVIDFGVDGNRNGVLDAFEVFPPLRRYVCNGAPGAPGSPGTNGHNASSATAAEPAGANCATGGTRIDFGPDANGNGVLDAGEVVLALRRYVCNGAQGTPGSTGAAGPAGPSGALGVYGDGSAGALVISSNTDWVVNFPGANLQFTDITVNSGVNFKVPSGTVLRATGNVTINGALDVAPGAADSGGLKPLAGVALSAASNPSAGVGLSKTGAAQLVRIPALGGGAGARNLFSTGSEGGGSLAIYAKGALTVGAAGVIRANGQNGVNPNTASLGIIGAGGGAGGVVVLLGKASVTVNGGVYAIGGNGANGWDGNGGSGEGGGGGGGGGIVHLLSSTAPSGAGVFGVNAGFAGTNAPGTSSVATGGGGGACGGSGGAGGGTVNGTTSNPGAGTVGWTILSTVPTPENLVL